MLPDGLSYYLDPFGCAKNQVDAENLMAVLNAARWRAAPAAESADLIIVNSCGFIESAKRESIEAVIAWRRLYPEKKILLAGCLVSRYGAELAASLSEADSFFGAGDAAGIAAAAAALFENGTEPGTAPLPEALRPFAAPSGPPGDDGPAKAPGTARSAALPAPGDRPLLSLPGSAYVKIAEGCDNRCSFCAIPLIRGPLKSRRTDGVLAECRRLLERGVKELCLVGQDLGSWGRDLSPADGGSADGRTAADLVSLLERIAALPGHFLVRLLYIHPDHFPPGLLELCAADRRFLPYFDIPFQHGSDRILKAMGRRGSAGSYLDLIARIRAALPGAVIRSTFLAGFPGETEGDFQALLDFQEKAELDWAGVFCFSREEGTPAYAMKDRVPGKTALARKKEIEARQEPITERRLERFTGTWDEVLAEEKIEGEEGLFLGRLPSQAPEVDGLAVISSDRDLAPGSLYPCKIFARAGLDLEVRVLPPGAGPPKTHRAVSGA
jgi:ribosomal protein S12 methylthiotransferase